MKLIVLAWVLDSMGAPWWVWCFFLASVFTEAASLPFYLRLIRRDRQG